MQAPPEPMQLPLDECMWTTSWNRAAAIAQLWPVKPVTLTGQTGGQDRSAPRIAPVRPMPFTGQADATFETARAQK
jgi:hypothetical protein